MVYHSDNYVKNSEIMIHNSTLFSYVIFPLNWVPYIHLELFYLATKKAYAAL